MQIRKIQIQNYRKLIGPVVIEDIGDGITVIAGDNEEGKSTLLQALRTALFDRHNLAGDAAESMQPFGHKVRPEIGLEFEIDGVAYRLNKGFCLRPSAELVTPTGTLAGLHAEEKLQELLGFRPPGKGQGKPDQHHGVFGMFWIEQGRAFSPLPLSQDNRTTLMSALESEVGQVLGGSRGRTLKAAIATQYRAFFTDGSKPKGSYAEAISSVVELEEEIAPKREQLKSYDGKVDELSRARDRLAGYEREGRLSRAQDDLKAAQAKLEQIETLRGNVTNTTHAYRLAEAEVRAPTAAVVQRDALIEREKRDREEFVALATALNAADNSVKELSIEFSAKAVILNETESALDDANKKLDGIDRKIERQRLTAQKDQLRTAVDAATEANDKARAARAASAAIKVDVATLKHLRTLDQKRVEAESALAGSSTLIQFRLKSASLVTVGGSAAPSSGDISVTDPTELEIAGVGQITVVPGGEELETKKSNAGASRRQMQEELRKVACTSLADADTQEQERRDHDAAAKTYAEVLKVHAPDGMEILTENLAEVTAAIAKLPDASKDDNVDRTSALASQRDADVRVRESRTERDAYQARLNSAKEELASQRALSSSADSRARESAAELERAREVKSDIMLREELAAASNRVTGARAVLEQAEKQLADADPEVAQLLFESARDGHKAIQEDIERLRNSASTLTLELQLLGQQGLGETLQELEGQLVVAIQHRDRLKREADALKLLYDTLVRAEQRAREAFLAPVQTRVQPYLRLLLPETELVLSDDHLGVTALRRNGQEEPFESLSVGAREQVAVLTRLAFADLLREQGTIAPVVLDDALVNTDPNRFKRMVLAIRKASKNLQIIVLTCNEAQWLQEGSPMIRLADCIRTRAA
jgi:DNA repair exonuclease SbcCD ATPase subunit